MKPTVLPAISIRSNLMSRVRREEPNPYPPTFGDQQPMGLQFTFHRLQVGIPRLPGMLFHFTINNPNPRVSRIWSYNFELYHVTNPQTAEIQFLGPLVANLPTLPDWLTDFHHGQERPCELVWNYERRHIQGIQDTRQDDVHFEIKGNLLVASDYSSGATANRE